MEERWAGNARRFGTRGCANRLLKSSVSGGYKGRITCRGRRGFGTASSHSVVGFDHSVGCRGCLSPLLGRGRGMAGSLEALPTPRLFRHDPFEPPLDGRDRDRLPRVVGAAAQDRQPVPGVDPGFGLPVAHPRGFLSLADLTAWRFARACSVRQSPAGALPSVNRTQIVTRFIRYRRPAFTRHTRR